MEQLATHSAPGTGPRLYKVPLLKYVLPPSVQGAVDLLDNVFAHPTAEGDL